MHCFTPLDILLPMLYATASTVLDGNKKRREIIGHDKKRRGSLILSDDATDRSVGPKHPPRTSYTERLSTRHAMLWRAVLRRAAPRCAALRCAVPCRAALRYGLPCHPQPRSVASCFFSLFLCRKVGGKSRF